MVVWSDFEYIHISNRAKT